MNYYSNTTPKQQAFANKFGTVGPKDIFSKALSTFNNRPKPAPTSGKTPTTYQEKYNTGQAGNPWMKQYDKTKTQVANPGTTTGLNTGNTTNTGGIQTPKPAPQQTQTPTSTTGLMSSQPAQETPLYYANQVEKAGQQTPWEQAAAENLANAKGMQNFGQFAPNAEAPFYAGASRPQMETLITRPDLVGRDQTDLYNKFANLYGTQANVGLQAAQTAAARGLEAAQSGLSASLPQQMGLQSTLYNPLQGAGAAQGLGTRSLIAGDVASAQDLREKRNTAAANLSSIGNVENLMKQVLGTNVNPSDINAINSFINTISSNVSSPQYQAFNQYLSSLKSLYADYLSRGGTLTNMSREEANSLLNGTASAATLLKGLENLRNEAGAYLSGYDTQINQIVGGLNTGTPYTPTTGGSSGSTGGGLSGYANGGAF